MSPHMLDALHMKLINDRDNSLPFWAIYCLKQLGVFFIYNGSFNEG